jgi:neurexin
MYPVDPPDTINMLTNLLQFPFNKQTPASGYPGVMDDLIFSGAGSGCRGDDEDECMPPFENGSGDDLITPVYVPPTKQTTVPTKTKPKENEKVCDDEDCLHGSGSGEVTDAFTTTSVTAKTDVKGMNEI